MPVRAIKQIECRNPGYLIIPIPKIITDAFPNHRIIENEWYGYNCLINRHFDSNKNLVRVVNESADIPGISSGKLTPHEMTQKYGFSEGDYLEVIFNEVKDIRYRRTFFAARNKEVERSITLIFPERMIEDLEFDPEMMGVK